MRTISVVIDERVIGTEAITFTPEELERCVCADDIRWSTCPRHGRKEDK